MCLAIPGKIVKIDGDQGEIDFGGVMSTADRECVLVNGTAPERLYRLLTGETVTCTVAKGGL